jgi:hypothetical protein
MGINLILILVDILWLITVGGEWTSAMPNNKVVLNLNQDLDITSWTSFIWNYNFNHQCYYESKTLYYFKACCCCGSYDDQIKYIWRYQIIK